MPTISTSTERRRSGVAGALGVCCIGCGAAGLRSEALSFAARRRLGKNLAQRIGRRARRAATPSSDSLRFANGLLRQKKFELAAQRVRARF